MSWKVIYHPEVTGDLDSLGRAEAAKVMRAIEERRDEQKSHKLFK